MSSSILSQSEIDALLQSSSSQTPSEDLVHLLQTAAVSLDSSLQSASRRLVEVEGLYLERLEQHLGQTVAPQAVAVAADLADVELVLLISRSDARLLAERLSAAPLQIMQTVSQAWVKEMAALTGASCRIYQGREVDLQASALPTGQGRAYLARYLLRLGGDRLEFCVVIDDLGRLEKLAQTFEAQGGPAGRGGRLLKGPKSPVTDAVFTPIAELATMETKQTMHLLEDIELTVTVELGTTTLTLNEILELKVGSVIKLERLAGELVDVYVNNNRAARGEVVVLEENFGVRILEILPKSQRVRE